MSNETKPTLDEWALVEIMGHKTVVGRITEAVIAGAAFLRIDVPAFNGKPAFTQFYGAGSVYCISPMSEDVARGLLTQSRFRNEPVSRFELPQLAEKVETINGDYCPNCRELEDNCVCSNDEDDD
jgi:hypothetical protein